MGRSLAELGRLVRSKALRDAEAQQVGQGSVKARVTEAVLDARRSSGSRVRRLGTGRIYIYIYIYTFLLDEKLRNLRIIR